MLYFAGCYNFKNDPDAQQKKRILRQVKRGLVGLELDDLDDKERRNVVVKALDALGLQSRGIQARTTIDPILNKIRLGAISIQIST